VALAYRRAKADRRGCSALYRVGNEWSPIYDKFMGNFIEALLGDDLQRLRSMLENFFVKASAMVFTGYILKWFSAT